jgi:hypothetical protein
MKKFTWPVSREWLGFVGLYERIPARMKTTVDFHNFQTLHRSFVRGNILHVVTILEKLDFRSKIKTW